MRPSVRYSLRLLLVTTAMVAVLLGWWIRPRIVEEYRPDGTLSARFRVKYDIRGQLVACGLQEWFLPDGQCFRRQEVRGALLSDGRLAGAGRYAEPVYPSHIPPDPPTAEYVAWLVRDRIPISTDLPRTTGARFAYP